MKRLVIYILLALTVLSVTADETASTVRILFSIGSSRYNASLDNNEEEMHRFIDQVNKAIQADNLLQIEISAYASPDGTSKANMKLSANRCEAIKTYLMSHTAVTTNKIEVHPKGIAWDELRQLVANTPEVPKQKEVLNILDNTPIWVFDSHGRVVDGRKAQLMNLWYGRPYRWMMEHLFPQLRQAIAITLETENLKTEETDHPDPSEESEESDQSDQSDVSDLSEAAEAAEAAEASAPLQEALYETSIHHFALKTNLLYDAILMPDLELEWFINQQWSVSVEGSVAWWSRRSKEQFYRLAIISPEVRRWFLSRKPYHGLYVGAFAGYVRYDLGNYDPLYQGDGVDAGLSVGYSWPISKHLSMEAGVGVGYLYTQYKQYYPLGGGAHHYIYEATKKLHYFGPLKAKLALVWHFDLTHKHRVQ